MIRDLDVFKGLLQLLLVIGGVAGLAYCGCVAISVLLHASPPGPHWLIRSAGTPALPVMSLICALGGTLWMNADRRHEREMRGRRPVQAPRPPGQFSAFELKPECRYRVTNAFTDFDGRQHPAGETWRYLSRNFLPYDAGLTLYVSEAGAMTSIRLQAYPEAQGPVIDRFFEHVREEPPTATEETQV